MELFFTCGLQMLLFEIRVATARLRVRILAPNVSEATEFSEEIEEKKRNKGS